MSKRTGRSNPVAKHARTFNRSTVQQDKKKAMKRGYHKHASFKNGKGQSDYKAA